MIAVGSQIAWHDSPFILGGNPEAGSGMELGTFAGVRRLVWD